MENTGSATTGMKVFFSPASTVKCGKEPFLKIYQQKKLTFWLK